MSYLKKIKRIKNYRIFLDFESDQDIRQHEIIYAPNGSGKTHLSRMFEILQDPDVDLAGYISKEAQPNDAVEFELAFDDKSITHATYVTEEMQDVLGRILVFNNDYVNKNISCPDFKDKKLDGEIILELGAEDAAISGVKRKIKYEEEKIVKTINDILEDFKKNADNLKKNKYSADERNIWKALDISKILTVCSQKKHESIFDPKQIKEIISCDYSDAERRREKLLSLGLEKKIAVDAPLPTLEIEEIRKVLREPASFPSTDNEIANDVKLIADFLADYGVVHSSSPKLLDQAIAKSEADGRCMLCGRTLDVWSKELFKKYKTFLAGEKSKYEARLLSWQNEVNALSDEVTKLTNSQEEKVNRLCSLLKLDTQWVGYDTDCIISQLNELYELIGSKIDNSSNKIEVELNLGEQLQNLTKQIETNNRLISKINRRMDNASTALAEARTSVGEKELQEFIINHKKLIDDICGSQDAIKALKLDLKVLEGKAPKKEVRQQTCKLFNFFMKNRLGIEKYNAEIINQQIIIKLNDVDISESMELISDGEKTMMGLAYYMASSIQTLNSKNKFGEAIFVIDDPASSVSYSNIFGICTLLSSFQNDIIKAIWDEESAQNGQMIILTHNIQFFNIMRCQIWNKERAKESQEPKNGFSILSSDTVKKIEVGRLLSDFEISLLAIYQADKDGTYFNVCNNIRRVCEILRHFYGIREDFSSETLKKIFPYITGKEYDALYKTINFFSHGSANSSDILPPEILERATEEFIEIFNNEESPFVGVWGSIQELSSS